MDFQESAELAAFRGEARSFLDQHANLRADRNAGEHPMSKAHEAHIGPAREWQRTLSDHGWAGITWPEGWGGRGLSSSHESVFLDEQAKYDVPVGPYVVAIGMVGPTLIEHGTAEQQQRFLPAMLRGEHIWCQLFSEPAAGSDLAALRTSAVRDGDEFVVNGQKVWTSGAHFSDWGILLVRSDIDAPKHRGITYLLVDMTTPGIDIRPLEQINRAAHFNEVFLTDVRIPVANVVGEINGGWAPTMTTLTSERGAIGASRSVGWADIEQLAKEVGVIHDPLIRQDLARAYTRFEIMRYLRMRVQTASEHRRRPGPEAMVIKLAYSERMGEQGDLVMKMMGAEGLLFEPDAARNAFWHHQFLSQWSSRIGGGTDQVQRNTIGERALGLPREPRPDKDVPFRDLPK